MLACGLLNRTPEPGDPRIERLAVTSGRGAEIALDPGEHGFSAVIGQVSRQALIFVELFECLCQALIVRFWHGYSIRSFAFCRSVLYNYEWSAVSSVVLCLGELRDGVDRAPA